VGPGYQANKADTGPAVDPMGKPANEPPRPVHLRARSVEAWVQRAGEKNTLEKLWTEGSVHVRQEAAKADEKGVDIKGETLRMDCFPEGNVLVVTGDLAELRLDKIYILGPEVNIDQATNKAWVNGIGAMQMESQANLAGGEAPGHSVPLTVHWNRSMLFKGQFAEFNGNILAEQENSGLECQTLQVFFDRPISLKEGQKGDQPAKVRNMVCDKSVRLTETVFEGEKLLKSQRLEAQMVEMNTLEREPGDPVPDRTPQALPNRNAPKGQQQQPNTHNELKAVGPGTVTLYQRGGADPLAPVEPGTPPGAQGPARAQPKTKAEKDKEDELRLTHIEYRTRLYGNNKTNTAIFWGNVRVLNMPCENPQQELDFDTLLDNLPREAMYMRCDQLTVLNRGDKTRSQQEMLARGHVMVQAREFWGRADTVTYNEAKDQVIFDGGENGYATLYKVTVKGAPATALTGKRITYIRSSGAYRIDGGKWITGIGESNSK
jgi:hypothetical protein